MNTLRPVDTATTDASASAIVARVVGEPRVHPYRQRRLTRSCVVDRPQHVTRPPPPPPTPPPHKAKVVSRERIPGVDDLGVAVSPARVLSVTAVMALAKIWSRRHHTHMIMGSKPSQGCQDTSSSG